MVELKLFIPRMPHRAHNELYMALAKVFGGCSILHGLGVWYDANGTPCIEGMDMMLCYIQDTPEAALEVETLARKYKHDAAQAEVLFSINGSPTFIKD